MTDGPEMVGHGTAFLTCRGLGVEVAGVAIGVTPWFVGVVDPWEFTSPPCMVGTILDNNKPMKHIVLFIT